MFSIWIGIYFTRYCPRTFVIILSVKENGCKKASVNGEKSNYKHYCYCVFCFNDNFLGLSIMINNRKFALLTTGLNEPVKSTPGT
jgi:hypothetical protein